MRSPIIDRVIKVQLYWYLVLDTFITSTQGFDPECLSGWGKKIHVLPHHSTAIQIGG